ncbi:MAG: hypothetical protein GY861_00105 [bacterium]|nr:hypothetical protein [bacterium]
MKETLEQSIKRLSSDIGANNLFQHLSLKLLADDRVEFTLAEVHEFLFEGLVSYKEKHDSR